MVSSQYFVAYFHMATWRVDPGQLEMVTDYLVPAVGFATSRLVCGYARASGISIGEEVCDLVTVYLLMPNEINETATVTDYTGYYLFELYSRDFTHSMWDDVYDPANRDCNFTRSMCSRARIG